jgi:ubiquinone biosynthesis protein
VMLQKTMVVVEGVARKLDPHLNMWVTAEPVVGAWIADNLGPRGKIEDFGRGLTHLARIVADAPQRLESLAGLVQRLEDASANTDAAGGSRAKDPPIVSRAVAAALWAIVALLLWIALKP